MRARVLAAAAALLCFLAASATARASVVQALTLAQMSRQADVVFVGLVTGRESRWDHEGRIVTDVTLVAETVVKGGARDGDEVVVTVLGGAIGDLAMTVEGEARFTDGERALVFGRHDGVGQLRPVGMSQGVMRVTTDGAGGPEVLPGGAGLTLVAPAGSALRRAGPALTAARSLASVLDEVRGALGGTP